MSSGVGFEWLAMELQAKLETRISRLRTMKSLRRHIQRAWVELVQKSATKRRGAPATSLIAREGEVGWKVWGKYDRSLQRYLPRIERFRELVRDAVRDAALRALRGEE